MRTIQAVGLIAVVATMFGLDLSASAESPYPNRPIHIVVPYPAGGIVDIVARAVTEQVGRDWKAVVVADSRPGANSNIGTASVARSDPDGYTWLVTGPAALVNPTLYKDAGWDAMKGLTCVGLAIWNQSVAVVNPAMPAADSQCPIFDFNDPIAQNCFLSLVSLNARVKPAISIGSPRAVPVPWASKN